MATGLPANRLELARLNRRRLLALVGATGAGLLGSRTRLAEAGQPAAADSTAASADHLRPDGEIEPH